MVAILVTYANSQKCGERANDLQTNCYDLKRNLDEIELCQSDDELKKIMDDFHRNIGDSENGGIIDSWKCDGLTRFYICYLIPFLLLIFALFLIPILFFVFNFKNFIAIFVTEAQIL